MWRPSILIGGILSLLLQALLLSEPARAAATDTLSQALGDRITQVPEFEFIRHEADRLGIRAYLFGGTAAGYAHYVKWDLQRENGDSRFQADRFDYDYTNIYRSTQDLDIVIDGPAEKAKQLEAELARLYPHLQGSKSVWEVRLLKEDMGDKQALLHNLDFLNQHTDSNSTGLIEITKPLHGEAVVRDLRDWDSPAPHFLRDVQEGRLHYYFSPRHGTTSFARSGRNPALISVIRYLTKAFQYELQLRPEDLAQVKSVIDRFDPMNGPELKNDYVKNWLLKKDNGRKLIQNAVNMEYAWKTLESLGLRKKLIAIEKNPTEEGSLAWWMSKKPLASQPLLSPGSRGGKTAAELVREGKLPKDLILAHETRSFLAYESITRAHTGDPNVLISRKGVNGETAIYGDGFYLRQGHEGAQNTGWTIRFRLDPQAREGRDFHLVADDYVTIQNKTAIRVIPESLKMDPVEYLKRLAQGEALGLKTSDRGILEKFKRRFARDLRVLTLLQRQEISGIVKEAANHWLADSKNHQLPPVLKEWFSLEVSTRDADILSQLIASGKGGVEIIQHLLNQPHWRDNPELVKLMIRSGNVSYAIAEWIVSHPLWKKHPEWIDDLVKSGKVDGLIAQYVLSQPDSKYLSHLETLLKRGNANSGIAQFVLSRPHWADHPEFVETLIQGGKVNYAIAEHVLSQPHWKDHPEFVARIIQSRGSNDLMALHVLSQPHWKDHPEFVERLLEDGKQDSWIARFVLSQPHWQDHPEFVEQIIERGKRDADIAQYVLSRPHMKDHSQFMKRILENGRADVALAQSALPQPHWKDHPEFVAKLIQRGKVDADVAQYVLSQPHWKDHPEFVEMLISGGKADRMVAEYVLVHDFWKNHPALLQLTGGATPTVQNLRKGLARRQARSTAALTPTKDRCSLGFATLLRKAHATIFSTR